jgi:hypothetical protein
LLLGVELGVVKGDLGVGVGVDWLSDWDGGGVVLHLGLLLVSEFLIGSLLHVNLKKIIIFD